jgi:hypothetical protein
MEAGPCQGAVEAYAKNPEATVADVVRVLPEWAAWIECAVPGTLTAEQVARIVASQPGAAAKYLANRLTDQQVKRIVVADPWSAADHLGNRLPLISRIG